MELRDYQTEVINQARQKLLNIRRLIIQAPTGSGKTEIGIDIIKRAVAKGKRVLFMCNRITLIDQAYRRFQDSGVFCGRIQGQNTIDSHAQVLICSIQTLSRRKTYPPADMIIIDEAHGCTAESYRRLIELWNDIPIIGLTATPFSRGLGKKYPWGTLFEDIVCATSIRDLISMGFLVDAQIYAPSEPDLAKIKIVAGDYAEKELGEAVDKPQLIGDIVDQWRKLANNKPTVCFATNISHSKHIVASFQAVNVPAEHIDCYSTEDERKSILERVKTGKTIIVSNVGILTEGWDFPALECMILARPTKSLIRYLQMAGRILRPYPGKQISLILDHSGAAIDLGHPCDDQEMCLDDGKPKKKSKPKKKERPLKKCPQCKFLSTENPCPKCGHARQRQNATGYEDGELVEFNAKSNRTVDRQAFFESLVYIAKSKNYKKGWVEWKYKEYFGQFPKGRGYDGREPIPEAKDFVTHCMIKYKKEMEAKKNGTA